jgi:hypothetical protein
MTGFQIDRRLGNVFCILCWPDLGAGFRQHNGVAMDTSTGRTWISDFRGRRRVGRDNLCSNRFGRSNRNVLCWIAKISEIEFIRLRQGVLREAGAGRRWITDGSLGNRCGYPRREQSAKTCKAKRRDPNCSDHNRTPFFKYRELRKKPRLRRRCLTGSTNPDFVSCTTSDGLSPSNVQNCS